MRTVVELQALATQAALALAGADDAPALAPLYRVADGPAAWLSAARAAGANDAADRAAYLAERAVFQYAARCAAPSRALLELKMETLVQLSVATQLDVDAFWDRVARVCAGYVRSVGDAGFADVHTHLVQLVHMARGRLCGPKYARLGDWWLVHAEQVRCTLTQARHPAYHEIAQYTQGIVDEPSARGTGHETRAADAAVPRPEGRVRDPDARPAADGAPSDPEGHMPAASETPAASDPPDAAEPPRERLAAVHLQDTPPAAHALRAAHAAWRTHRDAPRLDACVAELQALRATRADAALGAALAELLHDALDATHGAPTPELGALLEAGAAAVARCACAASYADAIHALRVACEGVFVDGQPGTYDVCVRALACAADLAAGSASRLQYVSEVAFHYGSRLYAAAQHGHAVRFLLIARDTAHGACAASPGAAERAQPLRKDQVLAGAYQHMGDHARAYAAYWHGLRACTAALDRAGAVASAAPLPDALDAELAQPAALVRGALHVAVYALLRPAAAAESGSFLAELGALPLSRAARGAWLEYAALALEPMLLRDETPAALHAVLDAACDAYALDTFPLRRTRVRLKRALYDTLRGAPLPEDLAEGLGAPLAHDAPLAPHRAELECTHALLAALAHVHHGVGDAARVADAAAAARRAFAYVRERIGGAPPAPTPTRTSARTRAAPRTPAPAVRTRAARGTPGTRTPPPRARTPPRTPAPDPPRAPTPPAAAASAASSTHALATLLSAVCDALTYAGHDAALEGLDALAALAADAAPALAASARVRAAQRWLALGVPERACAALRGAAHTPEALYTLAHAECAAGDAHAAQTYAAARARAAEPAVRAAPAWERVAAKAAEYAERAAGLDAYAALAHAHGAPADALGAALHALRTHLRSALLLGRAGDADVFGGGAARTPPSAPRYALLELRALHWRVAHTLGAAYVHVSELYAARGAARDAAAFAHEAVDFAAQHPAPLRRAAALVWHAELLGAQRDPAAAAALDAGAALLGADASAPRVHAALVAAEWSGAADAFRAADAAWRALGAAVRAPRALPALHMRIACGLGDAAVADDGSGRVHVARAHALLRDAERALHGDAVWSMLPEAARALPGAVPRAASRAQAALARRVAPRLDDAERHAAAALRACAAAGDVRVVRRALRAAYDAVVLQAAVRPEPHAARAARAAALLHASVSVSVRRAHVDGASRRAHPLPADGQPPAWAPQPPAGALAPSVAADAEAHAAPALALPPRSAAVVLALSDDRRELQLARIDAAGAVVYTLPIDRQSRREGEEEPLTPDAVLAELRGILAASNAGVQGAKDVHALEARKAWWTERRRLDDALRTLLEAVQATWLGAFQGVLAAAPAAPAALAPLRAHVERALAQACIGRAAPHDGVVVSDAALACLAALPSDCPAEVLEDWAHFAMDALQLSGIPVAQDEVDVDELCVDLRGALEEHRGRTRRDATHADDADAHLFLVLDRELAEIPWESLPVLRTRSVSRAPALELLAAAAAPHAPLTLHPARTAYLLNPGGDLVRSEARFAPALRAERAWRGTIGHAPVADEVARALADCDTFLYFGHAGAEAYVPATQLRTLPRCAAAMLWGCSSGALRDYGEYGVEGTPLHYLAAQCPALLANLWDATDKELDGVCEAVLRDVGLLPRGGRLSLPRAVAAARSACRLPYLTGAAVVVYGLPAVWRAPAPEP